MSSLLFFVLNWYLCCYHDYIVILNKNKVLIYIVGRKCIRSLVITIMSTLHGQSSMEPTIPGEWLQSDSITAGPVPDTAIPIICGPSRAETDQMHADANPPDQDISMEDSLSVVLYRCPSQTGGQDVRQFSQICRHK